MSNDNNFDIDTVYESSWNEQENEYWKKKRAMNRQNYLTNKAYSAFKIGKTESISQVKQANKQYNLPKLSSTQLKRLSKVSFPITCNRLILKDKKTRDTSLIIVSYQKHVRISLNLQGCVTIHYVGTKPEYKQAVNYITAKKIITDVLK